MDYLFVLTYSGAMKSREGGEHAGIDEEARGDTDFG